MLPIGSIVYLKDGNQKLLIVNRGPIIKKDSLKLYYDYSACIYPVGLDLNNLYYFNKEYIDRVVFEGYCDDDEIRYQELYNNWLDSNDGEFQKGQVIN